MDRGGSFRSALGHRDYRWLISALAVSNLGSWAYNVALIVWIYDETRSVSWVGATTLARFLPALLLSAHGGLLAGRFERRRLAIALDLTSGATHVLLALAVAAGSPVLVPLLLAALAAIQVTLYQPAVEALTPRIVGENNLAAANALNGLIERGAVVVGPAVGAGLLVWFSPPAALFANAATFFYAAAAISRVRVRLAPFDAARDGGRRSVSQLAAGLRILAGSPLARILAGFSIVASFFYGTDTVLLVVLSEERLGTRATGIGYLFAGLGLGALIARPLAARWAARPDLGTVLGAGLVVYTLPTALMAVVHAPVIGFALQVVRGGGTLVVDVLALTAMGRILAPADTSRVFGILMGLVLAAISVGAVLTPLLLDSAGLTPTLLLFGLGPLLGLTVATGVLKRINLASHLRLAELVQPIAALEASPLFAALPRAGVEHLASLATDVIVPPDITVIRQGEAADSMYVIAAGTVVVTVRDQAGREVEVAQLDAGDIFGEIGLLERSPRDATCTARGDCRLYRIDGTDFTGAVHQAPQSGFLDRARHREAQTHHLVERPS
jgi:MFS family permease